MQVHKNKINEIIIEGNLQDVIEIEQYQDQYQP